MRALVEHRVLVSLACSLVVGSAGLSVWPFPAHDLLLQLIAHERPRLYQGVVYAYNTLWFSTPFLLLNVVASFVYIFVARLDRPATPQPLPMYPNPRTREDLFLILGEQHHRTVAGRASHPQWLVIPERGLYTGMVIVGAVGSGKTSACMYPYVEQLLAYRADDPTRKVAGLILEVKGDFCRHVRAILERHGRGDDYIEVSLDSRYRYNPLHNDLDAFALAYGIATLMTNLYGRGKEPFWQQASTNLVKFVILLHQVLDDYVTLFQVYEHVINPDKLRVRIQEGETRFNAGHRRIEIDRRELLFRPTATSVPWLAGESEAKAWTYWSKDLEDSLTQQRVPYEVRKVPPAPDVAFRAERFEAVKRWFDDDWMRMESKLRTSIVEGISVFLSLFDDHPQVKYTFCPPKSLYTELKDRWDQYDRVVQAGHITDNVTIHFEREGMGGELWHQKFSARTKMLEHSRELEDRISEGGVDSPHHGFVMAFFTDGFAWHEDELEDFVAFYRSGRHRSDDGLAKMEQHVVQTTGRSFTRRISAFGYFSRPAFNVSPEARNWNVQPPRVPW